MKCHSRVIPTIHRSDLNKNYYQNAITLKMDSKINGEVQLDFKHFLEYIDDDNFNIKYRGRNIGKIFLENSEIKSIELFNNDFNNQTYEPGFDFMQDFIGSKIHYFKD